jgi:iron complex transport system substrate-binding protein
MHNTRFMRRLLVASMVLLASSLLLFALPQTEKSTQDELRIVSLSPNVTETIWALGKEDLLVGRSDYCNYPQEALSLPAVGTLYSPSLEQLLALEPTTVISSAFVGDQFLAAVEQAGITVLEINTQESFSGTYELIRAIAQAVKATDKAELMILEMQNLIKEVALKAQTKAKPSVYMAFDFGSFDSAATADTFLSEMVELAGGNNVAKDGANWTYSKELLMYHDPEVILLSPRWGDDGSATIAEFTTTKPYSDLRGRIEIFDADMISRQGPRSAIALQTLFELIHQESL